MLSAFVASLMLVQAVDETGIAVARPIGRAILEPISGSYFQVFEFYGRPPHTQRHAERMVKGYRHMDREGHLAFVKDGATHFFLVLNFDLLREHRMWIGLNAECNKQADLKWLDDSTLAEGSFRAWSPVAQKNIRENCKTLEGTGARLPVYYDPTEFGVRWEVGSLGLNIQHMIVEFPVPPEGGSIEENPDEATRSESRER